MYGQTETTGIVSLQRVGEPDGGEQSIVPIGRPRGNVTMYVLDRLMRPVPPGVSGELFIAGTALARGYLGDPELTAERFVRAPWNPDERLYASGDVVRLGWDGTIEYRNRTDRQVKIRGLRVEPAEVDRVLLEHPGVREAVTVVRSPDGDGSVLVAYFAPEGAPVSVAALRAHARRRLPEHMVPSAFFAMDRLPQTPNGKLDLAALPDVAITRDQEVEYVEPRGDVEEALASIWRSTLDVERIGAGDNFFALGGHSLLAARVRSHIRQRLGVELPLDVLFDDQTLGGLARRIEETATGNGEAPPLRQRVSRPAAARLPCAGHDVARRTGRPRIRRALDRRVDQDQRAPRCGSDRQRGPPRRRAERSVAHHLPAIRGAGCDVVAGDPRVVRARGSDHRRRARPRRHPRLSGMARPRHPAAISG